MQIDTSKFYYDETSPSYLRWACEVRTGRCGQRLLKSKGDAAGTLSKRGYWYVRNSYKPFLVHRVIYKIFNPEVEDSYIIDHVDGDSLNNSINNLRPVTQTVNMRNRRLSVDNLSGVNGVCLDHKRGIPKWSATWKDLSGINRRKSFSCKKYGNNIAFSMACAAREEVVQFLNKQGAGYSVRHGKEK